MINPNPDISATMHRWAVALLPLVTGVAAVAIKLTADQEFTPASWWLLANAAITGALTVYVNFVRGTSEGG